MTSLSQAQTVLIAKAVDQAPLIDGKPIDGAWKIAPAVTVRDAMAQIDIRLQAVHTAERIFLLAQFADPDESRMHKPWVWDAGSREYQRGPEREDCLVFKWAMDPATRDLSLLSDFAYIADIWFWKAHRTDPSGYADDKYHKLQSEKKAKSMALISRSGTPMYLTRKGDRGTPAYASTIAVDYAGGKIPQFHSVEPTGSRADVAARGRWDQGRWCVELARDLNTGHADDVQFSTAKTYLFGVSRYEIAGREPDPQTSQPLYGAGDVGPPLVLEFEPKQ